MTTVLIVMNLLAFVVSLGAIFWAWLKVRADMESNEALLVRLKEIEQAHAGGDRWEEMDAEQRAAGKMMLTNAEMDRLPEMIKSMIYRHALDGLGLQVWLVGLGIALGSAANVLPLIMPS